MATPIRILILEDRESDAELMLQEVRTAGFKPDWQRVQTKKDYLEALVSSPDIILGDHGLARFDGIQALKLLQKRGLDIPFILVSGSVGEERAVEAMKNGASDCLTKDRLERLGLAVKHALEEKQLRDEMRKAENALRALSSRYATILGAVPDILMEVNKDKVYVWSNAAGFEFFGKDVIGKEAAFYFEGEQATYDEVTPLFKGSDGVIYLESWQRRKDGEKRLLAWWCHVLKDADGNVIGAISSARDITERKRDEQVLAVSEKNFRWLYEYAPSAFHILTPNGVITNVNHKWCELLGYRKEEVIGKSLFDFVIEEEREAAKTSFEKKKRKKQPFMQGSERRFITKDGTVRTFNIYDSMALDENGALASVQTTIEDITESKRAQEALRESEERYKLMFEQAPLAINVTRGTAILYCNPTYLRMFGFSSLDEIQKVPPLELFTPEYRPIILEKIRQRIHELPAPNGYEAECLRKDGTRFSILMNFAQTMFSDGLATVGFIIDITETKRAQEALQESENRFRKLILNNADAITLLDAGGKVLYDSPAAPGMLGYGPEDWIGRDVFSLIHPDDQPGNRDLFRNIAGTPGARVNATLRVQHKSGKWLWLEMVVSNLYNEPGVNAIVLNYRDITERKRMEEALSESEEKFSAAFRSNSVALSIASSDGRYVEVNQALCEMLGYSRPELIGKTPSELGITDAQTHKNLLQNIRTNGGSLSYEAEVKAHDGNLLTFLASTETVTLHDIPFQLSTNVNITERKKAEAALARERNLLRTLVDTLPESIYVKDADGRKTLANPVDFHNMGAAAEAEVLGKTDSELFPPDLAAVYNNDDQRVLKYGDAILNREEQITLPGGGRGWQMTSKVPLHDSAGQVVGLVGVGHDITEQRRTQEALSSERNLLRTLIDQIPDSIYAKDDQCRFVLGNLALARAMGAATPDDMIGKTDFDFYPRDLADQYYSDDQEVIHTGQSFISKEELIIHPDGSRGQVLTTKVALHDENGKVTGLAGIGRDITERKRAEDALAESNAKFRSLFESSPDSILLIDPNNNWLILDCNEIACRMNGYSRDELVGQSIDIFNVEPGTPADRAEYLEKIAHGEVLHVETTHRRKDGNVIPIEVSTSLIRLAGREMVLGIDRDITERKRAEDALKTSEKNLADAQRVAHIGSYEYDAARDQLVWSEEGYQLFGISRQDFGGHADDFFKRIHPEDRRRVEETMEQVIATTRKGTIEYRIIRPDGMERTLEEQFEVIHPQNERVRQVGTIQDITERKRAAEEIQKQLKELQRWDRVTSGREARILQLKGEVNALRQQLGEPVRYASQADPAGRASQEVPEREEE